MDDYIHHLLPYVPSDRLMTLSCGHVIPVENLVAWPIAKGPNNVEFDFTYEKRNLSTMMDELGNCIIRLCQIVPDGVVVFFPSYAYMDLVTSRWQQVGPNRRTIWDQLLVLKAVFGETKVGAGVEDVLREYSIAIDAGKGGILLSVVGGKMSEGINFSDRLGRAVIVVGLPFPNMHSAEWKAKLEYIEKATIDRGRSLAEGKSVAREFYENACMRAVNQSIGRAIRHRKDYASIILLDRRYDSQRIKEKLPGWIKQGLVENASSKPFTEVIHGLRKFYRIERTS